MRIFLFILITIHGLIHLFGFLKAFGISEFKAINQPVLKTTGLLWFLVFVLFILTAVCVLMQSNIWWLFGFLALIVSQVLIINHWSDAKYGTIVNGIILLATILSYSNYKFNTLIRKEQTVLLKKSVNVNQRIVNTGDLSSLPLITQKWLNNDGIVGKPLVLNVYLMQELALKLKPGQDEWIKGAAEQYFTTQPPAFIWSIKARMNPFLNIVGRDKFINGKGEMLIKLLSLIPVANAK